MRHPGGDRYQLLLPGDDDHHAGPGPSSSRRDRQGSGGARHRNGGELPRDRRDGREPGRGYDRDHRDRRDTGRGLGGLSHRDAAADEHWRQQGRKRSRSRDREASRGGRTGPPDRGRYQDYQRRDPDRRVLLAIHCLPVLLGGLLNIVVGLQCLLFRLAFHVGSRSASTKRIVSGKKRPVGRCSRSVCRLPSLFTSYPGRQAGSQEVEGVCKLVSTLSHSWVVLCRSAQPVPSNFPEHGEFLAFSSIFGAVGVMGEAREG